VWDPTLQATEGAAAEADHSLERGCRWEGPLLRLAGASLVLLVAGALGVGCGFGGGGGLTLGYLDWNENVANATLTKVLLEDDLGYDSVELKLARGVGNVYDDLIGGETDAFQDAWMFITSSTWTRERAGSRSSKRPGTSARPGTVSPSPTT
jgi:ABC-type proline/glycine betaine transport system substrate-binding protein